MSFLDELVDVTKIIEAPFKVGMGTINGAKDTANLVKDLHDGHWGRALIDGQKVIRDVTDVMEGLETLGADVANVPFGMKAVSKLQIAESSIISAAQLVINGMKWTTGSGTPYDGTEFRTSSERLKDTTRTINSADPHEDRWDGTAAQIYHAVNASHRRVTFDMLCADAAVAYVLDIEAGQVSRTRDTLDDQLSWLKAYDLATIAMNAHPLSRALKVLLDLAAASTATMIAGTTMEILLKNSYENARSLKSQLSVYELAGKDTSGNPETCDGEVFTIPDDEHQLADPAPDVIDTRLPDPSAGTTPPSRSNPDTKYTVPSPEDPPEYGPPATPYGRLTSEVPSTGDLQPRIVASTPERTTAAPSMHSAALASSAMQTAATTAPMRSSSTIGTPTRAEAATRTTTAPPGARTFANPTSPTPAPAPASAITAGASTVVSERAPVHSKIGTDYARNGSDEQPELSTKVQ